MFRPNDVALEIEAALAFGTGHHGTTRGCLLALAAELKRRRPRAILDVGTGTGVLAFAAAKILKQRVTAGDIDPVAISVARANARLNGIGPHLAFLCGARRPTPPRGPARRVRPRHGEYPGEAAPRARAVDRPGHEPGRNAHLSGLLERDVPGVLSAYAGQGLGLWRRGALEGWATLVLRRGGAAVSPTRRHR